MYEVIQNRKIRMAIVGFGRIAMNHFGSIEKHADNVELAAICDVNADALNGITILEPLPYLEMQRLQMSAKLILTY